MNSLLVYIYTIKMADPVVNNLQQLSSLNLVYYYYSYDQNKYAVTTSTDLINISKILNRNLYEKIAVKTVEGFTMLVDIADSIDYWIKLLSATYKEEIIKFFIQEAYKWVSVIHEKVGEVGEVGEVGGNIVGIPELNPYTEETITVEKPISPNYKGTYPNKEYCTKQVLATYYFVWPSVDVLLGLFLLYGNRVEIISPIEITNN